MAISFLQLGAPRGVSMFPLARRHSRGKHDGVLGGQGRAKRLDRAVALKAECHSLPELTALCGEDTPSREMPEEAIRYAKLIGSSPQRCVGSR